MAKITKESFAGVNVLALTALTQEYEISVENNTKQIDWLIDHGACAIWTRGLVGEAFQLTHEKSKKLLETFFKANHGRVPIGAGCSSNDWSEVIELADYAEKLGYDFIWVTPPMPPQMSTPGEIKEFYKFLIKNTRLPIGFYNSGGTGIYMPPNLCRDILDLAPERFVAMKDSQALLDHMTEQFRIGNADRVAFMSVAGQHYYTLHLGTKSTLCMPEQLVLCKALYDAFMAGDMKKALFYQHRVTAGFPQMAIWADGHKVKGFLGAAPYKPTQKASTSYVLGIDMGPDHPLPAGVIGPKPKSQAAVQRSKDFIDIWKPLDVDADPEKEIDAFGYEFYY